jgi:AraC-like DNA-binding protein
MNAADGRVAVSKVHGWIERARLLVNDPGMGLRAALFTQLGDFEALEWVAMSAPTWRAANEMACRYVHILNEAADYRLAVCGDKAHLMLGSTIPHGRVIVDYELAAYHMALRLRVQEVPAELEVWMKHAQPDDVSDYRAIFPGAKLVFGAAFNGFVTDAWRLDTPLPTANGSLHTVLRDHAERLLVEVAPGDDLIGRVSTDILNGLRDGPVAAEQTAARLGLTRRTLSRRLAQQSTSFTELLKEARYRTAMHYLGTTAQSVEDIAFLLGFSECAAFVRAFRRWSSGLTPLAYRSAYRARGGPASSGDA